MNFSRRRFIAQAGIAGTAVLARRHNKITRNVIPIATGNNSAGMLTIYHTNGVKGHLAPVYRGLGGLRQIGLHLENEKGAYLLLDAGGFLNNNGGLENKKAIIAMMNRARYSAVGIGGLDIAENGEKLQRLGMQFPLVNCNHQFVPALKEIIKPYLVIKNGAIKVGITAVSRPVKGAVYKDAIACANRAARFLKETEGCDLVICLSDLGQAKLDHELNDQALAESSEHIDMIIGNDHGKMHNNDMVMRNRLKHEIVFSAAMANALTTGKTIINFSEDKKKKGITVEHIIPGKPAGQKFSAAMGELALA